MFFLNFCKRVFNWFLHKDKILILIIFAGIGIRIFYLGYTDYSTRTHDVDGHIEYIKYITTNKTIPGINQCWECHQAPLYYVLASHVYGLVKFIGIQNLNFVLQILSLAIFLFFLVFSVKIFDLAIKRKKIVRIILALIVFWPSGIIGSVRIGNDVLFYALFAAGFYFLMKWLESNKNKNFYIASLLGGLSLGAKLTGVVLVILIIITLLYKLIFSLFKKEKISHILKFGIFIFFVFVFSFSIFYYRQIVSYGDDPEKDLFANTQALNGALMVGNKFINYTWFDVKDFINFPYTSPWEDSGGRQYYWNYLFKTSLFGEFSSEEYKKWSSVASNIDFIFLILAAYFLILAAYFLIDFIKKNKIKINSTDLSNYKNEFIISLFAVIVFTAISITYKIRSPCACNGDFRFIFPVIIPIGVVFGLFLKKLENKNLKFLAYFGYSLIILMTISSLLFFVSISGYFT